jgi:hypothetical protein
MKWCRCLVEQRVSYGLIDDDRVTEVSGSPLGTQGADGDMAPGDVIEVEVSDIGVLRNYVVAES